MLQECRRADLSKKSRVIGLISAFRSEQCRLQNTLLTVKEDIDILINSFLKEQQKVCCRHQQLWVVNEFRYCLLFMHFERYVNYLWGPPRGKATMAYIEPRMITFTPWRVLLPYYEDRMKSAVAHTSSYWANPTAWDGNMLSSTQRIWTTSEERPAGFLNSMYVVSCPIDVFIWALAEVSTLSCASRVWKAGARLCVSRQPISKSWSACWKTARLWWFFWLR